MSAVIDDLDKPLSQRRKDCDRCGGTAVFEPGCGAWVCASCEAHVGLARCFCGWAADGGDGHAQLVEAGEQIDDDY